LTVEARERAQVPFFGVEREFAALRSEMMERIGGVLASGQVLQGPEVAALEERVAGLTGRRHAVAVNSCTDALFFALQAAGVGEGDEVLVPDFSFVASASAILRAGATPVFVDIGNDFNLDLERAAELVTSRTRALVFVHLFGLMSDPQLIEGFGMAHGLRVIEDAAQSFGARFGGRAAGSVGLVSCFSFDPTKPISAPGSGGMVLTDREEVADKVRRARYHGKTAGGLFSELGYNSQMPTTTAAVLSLKIDHEPGFTARRREVAARYTAALTSREVLAPPDRDEALHIYHKYVVRTAHRDQLQRRMSEAGVATMIHYPHPLSSHPMFGPAARENPRAATACDQVLSLPIHPFLADEEVERVVGVLAAS
jgi:dTDP-4-amino-4,6-dideoxygalactose transaminase